MKHIETKILDSASSFGQLVIVVAVLGEVEDWSAYIGILNDPWTGQISGEHVARHGTKIEQRCAETWFPHWADRYKWRP